MSTQASPTPKTALAERKSEPLEHPALAERLPPLPTIGIDIVTLGGILVRSGYFADTRAVSQAIVKVLRGQELGIGPVTAMSEIHVIDGKPSMSATLMAALVRRAGYDYRVKLDEGSCEITFYRNGQEIGRSIFTEDDARTAGLLTDPKRPSWQRYRRNMLFARAMSNGARWYCPEIFGGSAYSTEELEDERATTVAPAPAATEETPTAAAATVAPAPSRSEELLARLRVQHADERAAARDRLARELAGEAAGEVEASAGGGQTSASGTPAASASAGGSAQTPLLTHTAAEVRP
ncbi:MAG: hypothetical protein QN174_07635 [Armatimonadota bacterium]|nr:hypothetical protein [Armatimonadota bacterium]